MEPNGSSAAKTRPSSAAVTGAAAD
jgi:hypothetical protein